MQRLLLLPILGLAAAPLATAQVFYGTDSATADENFRLDVASGVSAGPVFTGSEAWGLADDDTAQLYYMNDGATLRTAPYSGGAATTLGGLTYNGAVRSLVSLAHHNGVLYGTRTSRSRACTPSTSSR